MSDIEQMAIIIRPIYWTGSERKLSEYWNENINISPTQMGIHCFRRGNVFECVKQASKIQVIIGFISIKNKSKQLSSIRIVEFGFRGSSTMFFSLISRQQLQNQYFKRATTQTIAQLLFSASFVSFSLHFKWCESS